MSEYRGWFESTNAYGQPALLQVAEALAADTAVKDLSNLVIDVRRTEALVSVDKNVKALAKRSDTVLVRLHRVLTKSGLD